MILCPVVLTKQIREIERSEESSTSTLCAMDHEKERRQEKFLLHHGWVITGGLNVFVCFGRHGGVFGACMRVV